MRYVLFFSGIASAEAIFAWRLPLLAAALGVPLSPWWGLLLVWPSVSTFVVAFAYHRRVGSLYGKRTDGTLPRAREFIFLPWLVAYRTGWWAVRWWRNENAYDEVCDGVLVGRRLLDHEVPSGIDHVIDLTSEFVEADRLRSLPGYHVFPTLDGTAVSDAHLEEIAALVDRLDGTTYVHCAEGHGRAGMVVVLILLLRGLAEDVAAGERLAQKARPRIHLGTDQRARLERFWAQRADAA